MKMEIDKKVSHLIYFILMTATPFFLWVISSKIAYSLTFISIGVLFIFTKYIRSLNYLNDTLEIVFLFLLIWSSINRLGLGDYFPIGNVISICFLYIFLLCIKKYGVHNLNLKVGTIQNNTLISFVFALISVTSLSVWFISQGNNPYAEYIPEMRTALLILMGIGFATINAIYEEGIFRSILFSYFSKEVGFIPALSLQAFWFSFMHFQSGFPSGSIGILMTFVFGIMMGYLVHRTRGIVIPIIIHFIADLSIFLLVLSKTKGLI